MKLTRLLTLSFAASGLLMACGSSTPSDGAGGSSGSGGSAGGTGGSAGNTGKDASPTVSCISVADDLIADFTKDNGIAAVDGRQGGFYVYGDSKGTFDPPKKDTESYPTDPSSGNTACSGPGAFHMKATGFAEWGAAMGTDFMPKQGDAKGYYDASKYKGVSFWAKASAPLTGVQVSFPDIYTDGGADPTTVDSSASKCAYVAGSTINCSPYLVKFGSGAYATSKIDTEWKRFDVLFADTKQDEYNIGAKAPDDVLAVKYLTAMAIQVNAIYVNGSPTPNDFELWVDDVNFIK
jgi:hypothetical protein